MKAGSGKAEIRFPEGFFPSEGFVRVFHPLHARVLLLGDEPTVILSLEMTSLPDEEVEELCRTVEEETGAFVIWVTVTHTFSAPHFMPDQALDEDGMRKKILLREIVHAAVREACRDAAASVTETEMSVAEGKSEIPVSRDIELPGGWWIGTGGAGPSDKTLTVLRLTAGDSLTALILHLNVQPSVLDHSELSGGGKAVSSDFTGIACAELEKAYPGCTAFFLIGAAGDQAPCEKAQGWLPDGKGGWQEKDLGDAGIEIAGRLGRKLQSEAGKILSNGKFEVLEADPSYRNASFQAPAKKMNRNLQELRPARSRQYIPDGVKEQTIEALDFGKLVFIGVRPEITCTTMREIQKASEAPYTRIVTLVNGGAKYMADQAAYDRGMYEAENSPFMPGAAEMLVREAEKLLNEK